MITEIKLLDIRHYKCIDRTNAIKALDQITTLQDKLLKNHESMTWLEVKALQEEVNKWRAEMGKYYVPK